MVELRDVVIWTLAYGLAAGALLIGAGLATYYLAPRVGPNPLFGVRTPHSMSSKEVWDASNRYGGLLLIGVGVGTALAGLAAGAGLRSGAGIIAVTAVLMAGIIGTAVASVLRAKSLAQRTGAAATMVHVPFRAADLVPTTVLLIAGLVGAAFMYADMPEGRIATHFDALGKPNGWMGRAGATGGLAGVLVLLWGVHAAVLWVISLVGWPENLTSGGSGVSLRAVARFLTAAMAFGMGIVLYVGGDTWWYARRGAHLVPIPAVLVVSLLAVPALLIFLALMLARSQRRRAPRP